MQVLPPLVRTKPMGLTSSFFPPKQMLLLLPAKMLWFSVYCLPLNTPSSSLTTEMLWFYACIPNNVQLSTLCIQCTVQPNRLPVSLYVHEQGALGQSARMFPFEFIGWTAGVY